VTTVTIGALDVAPQHAQQSSDDDASDDAAIATIGAKVAQHPIVRIVGYPEQYDVAA
jgi:hypothetical protein